MTALRAYLPQDYCMRAARFLLDHPGLTLIVTGFYIPAAGMPETDGPPGALALGSALQKSGRQIAYVTDAYSYPLLRNFAPASCEVIQFPILGGAESQVFARQLLQQYDPKLLISVERCGITRKGICINFRGVDISAHNAKIDYLFQPDLPSIGIGDGGNEIGMGNLEAVIPTLPGLPLEPAITRTSELIVASVSNWGSYGLLAALSALTGSDYLPSLESEAEMIRRIVEFGACDGTTGRQTYGVDGYTIDENQAILSCLHAWLAEYQRPA